MGGTYPDRTHVGYKSCSSTNIAGSDGDIFPDSFRSHGPRPADRQAHLGRRRRHLGRGTLLDDGVISVPLNATHDEQRGFIIEDGGVRPDIEVENHPAYDIAGKDPAGSTAASRR